MKGYGLFFQSDNAFRVGAGDVTAQLQAPLRVLTLAVGAGCETASDQRHPLGSGQFASVSVVSG